MSLLVVTLSLRSAPVDVLEPGEVSCMPAVPDYKKVQSIVILLGVDGG
jgi:hypothetical protein